MGWSFPIQLVSFISGSVKVILKTKSHRQIMLTFCCLGSHRVPTDWGGVKIRTFKDFFSSYLMTF